MKFLIHLLIIYCSKKAYLYNKLTKYYVDTKGFETIYSTGLMKIKEDVWLSRIKKLQNIIGK
jgi:hypothetical protein